MNRILIPYDQAKVMINEADVLLFRGKGFAGRVVGRSGESTYSHVGVASWINGRRNTPDGILECVEFKEGSPVAGLFNKNAGGGGRSTNLKRQVDREPGRIDVYRPVPIASHWEFDENAGEATLVRHELDPRAVTDTMRKMTGLPYGWKRIWWIMKHKMIGFRLFYKVDDIMHDEFKDEIIYPVCSTAVAYSFNKNGYDLINNKADQWTEPADIARCSRLTYLFTLAP